MKGVVNQRVAGDYGVERDVVVMDGFARAVSGLHKSATRAVHYIRGLKRDNGALRLVRDR